MTIQIIRGTEVNRPAVAPLLSTVLDHATVVENGHFGLRNNEGLWPSYNYLDTLVPTPTCPDPRINKTFSFAEWVPGFEFAVHGGVQCLAVGLDTADMKAEAERVFRANEGKGVETALLENAFEANSSDEDSPWGNMPDLTVPGMSLIAALAALEGYAATVYAGQPTIHMPRAAATILFGAGALEKQGNRFFTKTGAKVAAGGGYDEASGLTDNALTMYATGEVYVERAEEISVQAHVIPGDGSNDPSSDGGGFPDNSVLTLVERMYRVGVDGLLAKVSGNGWAGTP